MELDPVYSPESTGVTTDNDDVEVDDTFGGITLLESNRHRKSALIINTGSAPMRVTTDGTSPSLTRGKLVGEGASLELSSPFCPTAAVKAICTSSVGTTANASEVD